MHHFPKFETIQKSFQLGFEQPNKFGGEVCFDSKLTFLIFPGLTLSLQGIEPDDCLDDSGAQDRGWGGTVE